MEKKGLISVIMPVYNTENYIRKAIESILNQTYKNFELLIVDDASTDNSYNIALEYQKQDERIKLLKNKNKKGISGAVNTGIEASSGKYITRMDSDDISLPERLEKQYNFLKNNKNYNSCSINLYYINRKGKKISDSIAKKYTAPYEWLLISFDPIPNAPILYSASIIKKHNLKFSYNYKTAEDYCFLKDYMLHGGKITLIDEPLYEYRFHEGSITLNNYSTTFKNSLEIINNYIKHISNLKIPKDYEYFTNYKNYESIDERIDIKSILKFLNKLLEDFKKYYKWSEEETKEAEDAIYDFLESTMFRKYCANTSMFKEETILQRCKRILKNEGIKGFCIKLFNKIFRRKKNNTKLTKKGEK
jgi:glycosyltransferase involved in cell wall biosynthesis